MARHIFTFEHEGKTVLGFDTALDSRAFAQAKLALFISEPGMIVHPDGGTENWNAQGVTEMPDGSMVIWGPPFAGKRLDLLIDGGQKDEALAALVRWLEALEYADKAPLEPFAALIAENGAVLFCPESLAKRSAGFTGGERYVHPDLTGTAAAAFTTAAMLYHLLAQTPPFGAAEAVLLHQDIREGNFLPLSLASPGVDETLAALIQQALSPGKAPLNDGSGKQMLSRFKEALKAHGQGLARFASFFRPLSDGERAVVLKERDRFAKQNALKTKTRRFVMRNAAIIFGCVLALVIAALVTRSVVTSRAELPTTKGMNPQEVIGAYYNAFGGLDHAMMEACLAKGVNKDDVSMVVNLFVMSRVRQAYEMNRAPVYLAAEEWKKQGGGPVDARVFGITDLTVERLAGGGETDAARWRARYTFWTSFQPDLDEDGTAGAPALPHSTSRIDTLTLARNKRGNWQISALERLTESPQSSD